MRSTTRRLLAASALGFAAFASVAISQVRSHEAQLTQASADQIIHDLADALEQYFLVPEVGRRYAAELRKRVVAGHYRSLTPSGLADAVTEDLQRIYPDGHLRLRAPSRRPMLGSPSTTNAEKQSIETGIEKSGWLAPGVAYISFELFPGSNASLAAVREFLEKHSSAQALIIDVRTHGGGYTDEFDVIASYVYDRPTELIYQDTREPAFRPKPDTATLKRIQGPAGMVRQIHLAAPTGKPTNISRAKIFVLTSGYTGSAAEHLAFALKRTGRATIVGEVTAGMGHFGRIVELPAGFSAFIPIGRPFDPSTDQGWEGIGVQPHVAVPARRALEVTLLSLGFAETEARQLSAKWMPAGEMERVVPLRGPGERGQTLQ